MSDRMREDAAKEAARNTAVDEYFKARPQLMWTRHEECLVEVGFNAAWQAARTVPEEKMVAFIKEVSEQKPEKPDYWSSCGQCSRNQSEAEDIILSLAAAPEGKK